MMAAKDNFIMQPMLFPSLSHCDEVDWVYHMRREMQEIIPRLFLGPYAAAKKSNLEMLLKNGITHIVCVRQDVEANLIRPNFPEHFLYLVLDIGDKCTENIIKFFPRVKEFIDSCLKGGGKVLVHGNGGISRSAAIVIAYVMETFGLCYKQAFLKVQQKRFCIQPNDGFAQQLIEYEPIYRARLELEQGQCSKASGVLKRKHFEEDEDMDMT